MGKWKGNRKVSIGLAIAGTVLVLLPVAAPFIFFIISLPGGGRGNFDYFLPAEVFPLALIGALLLLWASGREKLRFKLLGFSFSGSLVALVGSQALAVVLGLASGKTPAKGLPFIAVMGAYALYPAGLVILVIGGILLIRDLRHGASQA